MNEIKLNEKISRLHLDDRLLKSFYLAVNSGTNKVFHNVVNEAVTLDDGWIFTVENTLFFIEDIVKHPKKFIKEEQAVVNVAKAKKINSKAVRYLATNTRDIDNIKADGSIIPRRVLTTQLDEDIGIYENRFVCALVNRLVLFVEQRYRDIMGKNVVADITNVNFNSEFTFGETEFLCDFKMRAKEPPKNKVQLERNNTLIEKVKNIRRRLQIIKSTPFMQELDTQKPVFAPINKTNLIKMNVNYNNCYKLWLYVSSYKMVGFSVEVQDKNLPVDADYFDDLTILAALTIKSLTDNEVIRSSVYEKIDYKPKKIKGYKVLKSYNYQPSFSNDNKQLSDELINEYYFVKMKNAFKRAVDKDKTLETNNSSIITQEKNLKMTFSRYYRSVSAVSDKMFLDVVKSHLPEKKTKRKKTMLEKKEEDYKIQKALLLRYNQLSKLKGEDYAKALRLVSRQILKVDSVKLELDELVDKKIRKKERVKARKKRITALREKPLLTVEKNKLYEAEIAEKAEQKRIEEEEREKAKREEAKRNRELKMLAYLKEKYE